MQIEQYTPFVVTGAAVTFTLIFLCRFVWFPPRPLKDGELPGNLKVTRTAECLTIRYRWGGSWDYIALFLLATAASALVLDALKSQDEISLVSKFLFPLVGGLLGYALLVRCFNHTIFTVTPEEITSITGPLPALEKAARFAVRSLTHIVSSRESVYGTYKLAVRDASRSLLTIGDSFWDSRITDAVARLIADFLGGIQLEIDHSTAAERRNRRRHLPGR